jgi:hypothetical protein
MMLRHPTRPRLDRQAIIVAAREVIILRRWHLLPAGVFVAVLLGLLLHIETERAKETRVILSTAATDRFNRITADMLTRSQVEQVALRTARLEAPTERDLIHLLAHVDEICLSERCKTRFAQTVRMLVRVENGRIVPALPGVPPAARTPTLPAPRRAPRPSVPRRPVPVPRPPPMLPVTPDPRVGELARDVAAFRREVDRLRAHEQDSAILNGVDNRLTDVEEGLAGVRRTVDSVRGALCSPALARLLTVLRLCP